MHLKRLELLGFKSFAQKTTMEFPGGVTAIVGPNGSGKSNIIDAVRWILGEREAKNIRAEKSENLIYSGGATRSRAGSAQVTITFDNSTHFFPVDFSEVAIRRRVSRDGTSDYFLNDSPIRLRDVIDFFSKARLGTKGLSIINQGNSDLFIRASESERRVMMEEILGLRQYQLKRHESENRLETTRINLDKVQALIDELLPHLRLLRRQTGKWEKHATIAEELRELENQYFAFRLHELARELAKIDPEIEKIEHALKGKDKELAALQAELGRIEKNQPQGDKNFNEFKRQQTDILNRRAKISKELGRLEAELEFLLSKPKEDVKEAELIALIKDIKKAIGEALGASDIAAIKKQLADVSGRIENVLGAGQREVAGRQKEIEKLKSGFATELETLEKNLADLGSLEAKLASEMRDFNTLFKKAFEAVEAKRGEMNVLENQKNRFMFDKERITMRRKDLESQAVQIGRDFAEFEKLSFDSAQGDFSVTEVEKRMLKLRGELASIGEVDQALIKEAKEMEERYGFLSTQLTDLTKAMEDLQVLIHDLTEKIHTEFTKALGAVNEEFNKYFRLMFNGGKARLHLVSAQINADVTPTDAEQESIEIPEEKDEKKFDEGGLEIELSIPRKNIKGLDMLSGGERSLVSIAVLFALISVSPPPFLVLDEVDAALDENNTKRFANLVETFATKSQFLLVTHNRATMSAAQILYGVTMGEDGVSRLLSLKLDDINNDLIPGKVA